MAYVHQNGFEASSDSQIKSFTAIDDEMLERFKQTVARKARVYERYYVAEIDK